MHTPEIPTTSAPGSAAHMSFRERMRPPLAGRESTATTLASHASWRGVVRDASLVWPGRGDGFVERLGQRKIWRWMLAYVATAWLLLQFVGVLSDIWPISASVQQGASLALLLGSLPCLVIAWFHGERGRQRVCRTEVALLGLSLAAASWVLSAVM